jgi:hypothetical protein
MEQVMLFATALIPFVTAGINLLKKSVPLKKNLVPSISFVFGLVLGVVAYPFTDLDLTLRLWAGGIAGLGATGLFEVLNRREGLTK